MLLHYATSGVSVGRRQLLTSGEMLLNEFHIWTPHLKVTQCASGHKEGHKAVHGDNRAKMVNGTCTSLIFTIRN